MDLKDRLREATTRTISGYEDIAASKTTSFVTTLPDDINAYNSYGMTRLHLALQSGDLHEVDAVLARPDLDVKKPSKFGHGPATFIEIYKTYNGEDGVTKAMTQKLQDRHRADAFVGPKPANPAI